MWSGCTFWRPKLDRRMTSMQREPGQSRKEAFSHRNAAVTTTIRASGFRFDSQCVPPSCAPHSACH
jgi:hypothetical protein